jgi:integrase
MSTSAWTARIWSRRDVLDDGMVLPFLRWAEADGVQKFEALEVSRLRVYRAQLATRPGRHGQRLQPKTILESHRAILCFLRWARREGYHVDGRILELTAPRVPDKEPTVYHIAQVRKVLACNLAVPTETSVVGSWLAPGCGGQKSAAGSPGPDGLSDVMTDSLGRGRVELRVRWDAGAKGRKSRRVPITPKLAAAIKRYEARHRPETDLSQLLINGHGAPYQGPGIKSMMDRLTVRAGGCPPPRHALRRWQQSWAGTSEAHTSGGVRRFRTMECSATFVWRRSET